MKQSFDPILGRGWGDLKQGKQIRDISEISVGDLVLEYSGQFHSKNIIHVRGKREYGGFVFLDCVWGDPTEPKRRASRDEFSIDNIQIKHSQSTFFTTTL